MSLIDQLANVQSRGAHARVGAVSSREREIRRVSLVGVAANLVLVVTKVAIGTLANSVAIISDGLNNLSDVLTSVLTIVGTQLSGRAADYWHPFGYGRIEYLTTIVIGALIIFEGAFSAFDAVDAIIDPVEVSYDTGMLAIMALAVVAKVGLGLFFRARGKALSSDAITASGNDALMDVFVTLSTIVSALVTMSCGLLTEGYVAVVISLLIVKVGIETLLQGVSRVVGRRVGVGGTSGVRRMVEGVPGVLGSCDWCLSDFGAESVRGGVYVEVDENLSVVEAANIANAVRMVAYTRCGVRLDAVGILPVSSTSETAQQMRGRIEEHARGMEHVEGIHGLRVNEGSRMASFDVDVDFGTWNREAIADDFTEWAEGEFDGWHFFVTTEARYVE